MDAAGTIAKARALANLTLRELATLAETSHSTLAAYEADRVVPSVETCARVVRAAGFDLTAELIGRVNDPHRGDELLAVLDLAGLFPARHRPQMSMPPFALNIGQRVDPGTATARRRRLPTRSLRSVPRSMTPRSTTPSAARWHWHGALNEPGERST